MQFKSTDKNDELFEEYQRTKDQRVRNHIIEHNAAFINHYIGKYYSHRNLDHETRRDLFQEGVIALMTAIDKFDPNLGYKFSTYSAWWLRQAFNNHLDKRQHTIRIPAHVKLKRSKLLKQMSIEEITKLKPTKTVLEKYDMSPKMLESVKASFQATTSSLDTELTEERDKLVQSPGELDFAINKKKLVASMQRFLDETSMKNRLVLFLRFGIIDESDVEELAQRQKEEAKESEAA